MPPGGNAKTRTAPQRAQVGRSVFPMVPIKIKGAEIVSPVPDSKSNSIKKFRLGSLDLEPPTG
jgi:hypothetical protein